MEILPRRTAAVYNAMARLMDQLKIGMPDGSLQAEAYRDAGMIFRRLSEEAGERDGE